MSMRPKSNSRGVSRFTVRVTESAPTVNNTVGNRRKSIFSSVDASTAESMGQLDDLDEYSITLPCQLTDFKPYLRRSMPSIPNGRHMSAGSTGSRQSDNGSCYSIRNSTTTTGTPNSGGVVDSAHIHLYLPKRDSVTNMVHSNAGHDKQPSIVHISGANQKEKPNEITVIKPAAGTSTSDTWRQIEDVPEVLEQSAVNDSRSHYIGELVFQINSFVYVGGAEAILNYNMLCRLNIEFIIDLTNDDLINAGRARTEVPCLCGARTSHSRTTLSISIRDDTSYPRPESRYSMRNMPSLDEEPAEDLTTYFDEAMTVFEKAQAARKSVLIYSVQCRNRAPAFAAAYLMKSEQLTRVQAVNKVAQIIENQVRGNKIRPGLCISDNLQRALMRWQTKLAIQGNEAGAASTAEKLFKPRKFAWG